MKKKNIDRGCTLEPLRQPMFWIKNKNKRTNGPVNAHLRPIYQYCLTRMVKDMYKLPGQGQSNIWRQFIF